MDKNYESNDGFSTRVWGNPLWMFLHCMSFRFVPSREQIYKDFLVRLTKVLPCRTCRDNFTKSLANLSSQRFETQQDFVQYIYDLHNSVPNKPHVTFTLDQLRKTFESLDSCKTYIRIYPETKTIDDPSFLVPLACEKSQDCDQDIWEPPLWVFLHVMSLNYPVRPTLEQRNDYKKFIQALSEILPQPVLVSQQLSFDTRHTFARSMFAQHNFGFANFEVMRNTFEIFRAQCDPNHGCIITKHPCKTFIRILPRTLAPLAPIFKVSPNCQRLQMQLPIL